MVTSGAHESRRIPAASAEIRPQDARDFLLEDPVLIVSRNSTYYAPETMMAVPLPGPSLVTFGSQATVQVKTQMAHIHVELPEQVEDRVGGADDLCFRKHADLGELHGAVIFRDNTLVYRHLCEQPTVIAQRILSSQVIARPGVTLPIGRGQTIGFGQSTDAFGEILWWYYFRVASLAQLKAKHGNRLHKAAALR